MTIKTFLHKVHNRWVKLRLQPIRVFCFHQVSEAFDPTAMWECDWMSTTDFKSRIINLQAEGWYFISLQEAYQHICNDVVRTKKYAVLTADDGYKTLENVLPWLHGQHIPITLFINGAYLDGIHKREDGGLDYQYLLFDDLKQLVQDYPLVDIQSHGWEHTDTTEMTIEEFQMSVKQNFEVLNNEQISASVKFHAYTWGHHNSQTDGLLLNSGIVPMLMDGGKNYNQTPVHRELL